MKRQRLNDALHMIAMGADWYIGQGHDSYYEGVMHELAHAVLIGRGTARREFEVTVANMKNGWQNRHEVAVMATQLAAFRALGHPQSIRGAALAVATSVKTANTRVRHYDTIAGCRRAILAYKPNPKHVAAIVRMIRHAEKALLR